MKKDKFSIQWKDGENTIHGALGINEARAKKLCHRIELVLHELHTPHENPEDNVIVDNDVSKLIIALAENVQELAFCAFVAGGVITDMKSDDLSYEDVDEEGF